MGAPEAVSPSPLRSHDVPSIRAAVMTAMRTTFTLDGPSIAIDPRIEAVRPDLADISLAGKLFAPHYAQAVERICAATATPLLDMPDGNHLAELHEGDRFWLLDQAGGWAWGWRASDHLVGYVAADQLAIAA